MESNGFRLIDGDAELFNRVEPLWYALRSHHAAASLRFRDQLESVDFPERREGLIRRGSSGLLITIASVDDRDVGYCVSLVDIGGEGHIESLFVSEKERSRGIGEALIRRALSWFESRAVRSVSLEVLVGNERALRFYERMGFFPRTYRLRQLKK